MAQCGHSSDAVGDLCYLFCRYSARNLGVKSGADPGSVDAYTACTAGSGTQKIPCDMDIPAFGPCMCRIFDLFCMKICIHTYVVQAAE